MAEEQEQSSVTPPEIRLAQRLIERRDLVPRVDVLSILREFADVEFVRFPINIDGVCLGLKAIAKRPKVLINADAYPTRQRFTLAHELGHVIIPWHIGNMVDQIDVTDSVVGDYFDIEGEANRFASELLMPECWVEQIIKAHATNPLDGLFEIASQADTSLQAASFKFLNTLSPGYSLAHSINNEVIWSGRSAGTLAAVVPQGADLTAFDPYPFVCDRWQRRISNGSYHLWHFSIPTELNLNASLRPWRDLLDDIVTSIVPGIEGQHKFKMSINGVTSGANSRVREDRRTSVIMAAMIQRLHANALEDRRYSALVSHPLFESYCAARALDFVSKSGRKPEA